MTTSMSRRADWLSILDHDLTTRRAHHAAKLAAERARIASERQAALDRAIVAARDAKAEASRGKRIVRSLVEP